MKKITTFADLKDIKGRNFNRMIYNQLTQLNNKVLASLGLMLILIATCLTSTNAQTIVNSPLSYIGMGELYTPETPSNSMMGGIGVSNSNGIYSNQIHFLFFQDLLGLVTVPSIVPLFYLFFYLLHT